MNGFARRLSLPALLFSSIVLAGGCGMDTQGTLEAGALDDDMVVAPEPSIETRSNELSGSGTQFVYVNFDGVTVSDCDGASYCSDATRNQSSLVRSHFGQSSIHFGRYGDAAQRQLILDELESAYGGYDVKFVTHRPRRDEYNMLVISPNGGPSLGVAPLDCDNRWTSDIAYVYRANEFGARTIANAAVHELGHSFGLTHVRHSDAYMHWRSGEHIQRFITSAFDSDHANTKCMSGNTQDPHVLLRTSVGAEPGTSCAAVDRVAGSGRHDTAAAVSRWLFPNGANVAVLVNDGDANPDALAAGPLAHTLGGPLLLTTRDQLPAATADELSRLGASRVIIAGGSGVVSDRVADQIRARGHQVERLSGSSRYATAAAIARKMGAPSGVAFIASGDNRHLVDALAATGAAGFMHAPILLVPKNGSIPAETRSALQDLGIHRTIIVGGQGPVPSSTARQLPNPQRISGANRYDTAVAVAKFGMSQGMPAHEVLIARSDKAPDALAAGASGKLMLLSSPTSLPTASWIFLEEHASRAVLLGGSGALNGEVARNACQAL